MIYKSVIADKYLTLNEYLDSAKEKHENKVFYTNDARQQAQYLQILKAQGMDAVELATAIDSPFMSFMESKNQDLHFLCVDADLNEILKEQDTEIPEMAQTAAETLFRKLLNNENLKVRLENLKDEKVSAMIEMTEEARRMQEMMKMYGMPGMDASMFGTEVTLVLNVNHPLVQYVLNNKDGEHTALFCKQLYDLALLGNKPLNPEEMTALIARSNEIMMLLAK